MRRRRARRARHEAIPCPVCDGHGYVAPHPGRPIVSLDAPPSPSPEDGREVILRVHGVLDEAGAAAINDMLSAACRYAERVNTANCDKRQE